MFFEIFSLRWRTSGRDGVLISLCLTDQKRIMRNNDEIIRQVEQAVGCLGQAYFGETCNLVRCEHKKMLSKPIMHTYDSQQGDTVP